jgi:hypothetical protein
VVYDYFEANGAANIAMESVERSPLKAPIPRLTVPRSVGVLEALLLAMLQRAERLAWVTSPAVANRARTCAVDGR